MRSLEHLYKKLIKANFAVTFNETCLNENKLPVYTNVKPHDPAVRQQPFLKAFRKRLVEHQIECKKNVVKQLDQEIRGWKQSSLKQTWHQMLIRRYMIIWRLLKQTTNTSRLNKIKTCKKLSNFTAVMSGFPIIKKTS